MILVFPLALSDKPKIKKFVRAIKHFGPYNRERALIMPTPSCMVDSELREAVYELANVFGGTGQKGRAVIRELPNDPEGGWPHAPNIHFQFIVEYVSAMQPQEPWMIIESDGTPTRHNWVSLIAAEYAIMGNPFMGAIEPSRIIRHYPDGSASQDIEGQHMVGGCGVYPPNYTKGVGKGGSPRVVWDFPDANIPYDIRCQYDHYPCSPTSKMVHMPRTVNWRPVDGASGQCFICDDEAGEPDEFGNSWARMVDISEVYYVHGCKDGSLSEILIAADHDVPAPVSELEPEPIQDTPPQILEEKVVLIESTHRVDVDTLFSDWKKANPDLDDGIFWDIFDEEWKLLVDRVLCKDVGTYQNDEPAQSTEPVKKTKAPSKKAGSLDVVEKYIKDSGKDRVNIKEISANVGIPLNKLRSLLKEEGSPFKVVAFGLVEMRKTPV